MPADGTPAEEAAVEEAAVEPAPSPAPERRAVRWLGLYPFEWVSVAMVAAAVVFLRSFHLRIDWLTVEYTIYPMFRTLHWNLLIGVAAFAVYTLLRRRRWAELTGYLRRIATPRWLLLWLRLWLACMLMAYAYFWLKVSIPLINHRLWDAELWQLDAWLHLGVSPSIFVTQLFEGTFLVPLLDRWYGLWIGSVILTLSFFCASPRERVRSPFMLSCVLLWTLGAWIYMALPALGPIYVFPEVWNDLRGTMPGAEGGQLALWQNYQTMLGGRTGPIRQFNPTRGIAALPSLHVAAHGLFAMWSWRHARPLFVPFLLATLFTFLGSILTGWHYAVDGYLGLLVAYLAYRTSLWVEERRGRGLNAPGPDAAG